MTLNEAVALLKEKSLTLVLYNEAECITSNLRGVAPLLSYFEAEKHLSAYSAVDKVVGKAAAFLYIALGVKHLHALTISESARGLLAAHSVSVTYETLVPRILNRAGDGYCPMESAVLLETEVSAAIRMIGQTRDALRTK